MSRGAGLRDAGDLPEPARAPKPGVWQSVLRDGRMFRPAGQGHRRGQMPPAATPGPGADRPARVVAWLLLDGPASPPGAALEEDGGVQIKGVLTSRGGQVVHVVSWGCRFGGSPAADPSRPCGGMGLLPTGAARLATRRRSASATLPGPRRGAARSPVGTDLLLTGGRLRDRHRPLTLCTDRLTAPGIVRPEMLESHGGTGLAARPSAAPGHCSSGWPR